MSSSAPGNPSTPPFADRLREALGDRTVEAFAREVGITLRTAQRWRAGDSEPSGADLIRVAHVLERDPRWFYERRTEDREPNGKAAA